MGRRRREKEDQREGKAGRKGGKERREGKEGRKGGKERREGKEGRKGEEGRGWERSTEDPPRGGGVGGGGVTWRGWGKFRWVWGLLIVVRVGRFVALSCGAGKSHPWTNTSVGGNFRRTFRTIGPYEFPQGPMIGPYEFPLKFVWTNGA